MRCILGTSCGGFVEDADLCSSKVRVADFHVVEGLLFLGALISRFALSGSAIHDKVNLLIFAADRALEAKAYVNALALAYELLSNAGVVFVSTLGAGSQLLEPVLGSV